MELYQLLSNSSVDAFVLLPELGEYSIRSGDVVLEVEGQSVAGYTRADVQTLLDYCANRGQHTLALTFIQAGMYYDSNRNTCL